MIVDKDTRLWSILIGAMLASPDVRKTAITSLQIGDVPGSLQDLWKALAANKGEDVRTAMVSVGLQAASQSTELLTTLLIKQLQECALASFCRAVMDRSAFTKPGMLEVDQVCETLESWVAQMRARQAQVNKPVKKEHGNAGTA